MGKTKEGKKEKKEKVEDVVMEEKSEKKSKKDKKRKAEEAEPVVEEKKEKKKKKKEAEPEVEEPKSEKKKKKKDKEAAPEVEEPKSEKKKKKSKTDDEKPKKKKKADSSDDEEETPKKAAPAADSDDEEPVMKIKNQDTKKADAVAACESTKCFFGNLSFKIDDDSFKAAVEPIVGGKIVSIKWMEDRETGKFRGSGIIEFDSTEAAGKAALMGPDGSEGTEIMGRPCRTRIWEERASTPKREARPLSERPDNCTTVFCGNLSFDIDDDKMAEFFAKCGEVKQIRWLTDRESGEFKGCGFVEFTTCEAVDAAVKMNGEQCLGRGIRLDYSAPRAPREY